MRKITIARILVEDIPQIIILTLYMKVVFAGLSKVDSQFERVPFAESQWFGIEQPEPEKPGQCRTGWGNRKGGNNALVQPSPRTCEFSKPENKDLAYLSFSISIFGLFWNLYSLYKERSSDDDGDGTIVNIRSTPSNPTQQARPHRVNAEWLSQPCGDLADQTAPSAAASVGDADYAEIDETLHRVHGGGGNGINTVDYLAQKKKGKQKQQQQQQRRRSRQASASAGKQTANPQGEKKKKGDVEGVITMYNPAYI